MSLISGYRAQYYADSTPKIVGGQEVKPPFKYQPMATIFRNGNQYCGGTFYNENTLITAAHCSNVNAIPTYSVHIHRHNLTKTASQENGRIYKVIKMQLHPKYNRSTLENDLAIWRLDGYPQSNKPFIELDDGRYGSNNGQLTTVIGWGSLEEDGDSPDVLQEVNVPIYDINKCKALYKKLGSPVYQKSMVCAGYEEGGKDSCQGDSGGPLFVNKYGKITLTGVVSWGQGCAREGALGVYTRVSNYVEWIKSTAASL